MATINYPVWDQLTETLRLGKYKQRYFTPEQNASANPLESLVVPAGTTEFFGTKVCNIYIVAQPIQTWPPPGYVDALTRHKETYKKFTKYETHVYMDYNIVNLIMTATPESMFQELMDATKVRMEEMCTELAEYGFIMEADITAAVSPDYFYTVLDAFYRVLSSFL